MTDSRTKNVVRNFKFSVLQYALQIIFQFLLRTALIYVLGKEYLGLNGLFTNILGVLNLAELGIGNAIVFSMYKPIAENDIEKVKALNNLYKKFYIIISIVVLSAGLIVMPFLRKLISGDIPAGINIYTIYLIYLINTVISYFIAHKRSLLFAYQRNDIENKIKIVSLLCLYVLQILLLLLFRNYYLYLSLMPVFTLIEAFLIYFKSRQMFPEIHGKAEPIDNVTKKEIKKNIFAMSFHKIGDVLVNSTDNILISVLIGLSVVGIYNNYLLITTSISSVILLFIHSLQGSVGNYIAVKKSDDVYNIYSNYTFVFYWLATFCSICLLCLFQDFILLWTRDRSYLIDTYSLLLLVFNFYLLAMRYNNGMFKNASGLMWNDRWKPFVQGIVNIVISIIFGKMWGLKGILFGTVVSSICAPIWVEPYVLYKNLFKRNFSQYVLKFLTYTFVYVMLAAITYFICRFIPFGYWGFVLKILVCLIVPNSLMLLIYFRTSQFKFMFSMVKSLPKKLGKKKS